MNGNGEMMLDISGDEVRPQVSSQIEVTTTVPPVGGDKSLLSVDLHGGVFSADNPRTRELSASEHGSSEFLNEETLTQTIKDTFRDSSRYQNVIVGESLTNDPEKIAKFKTNFDGKIQILAKWFVDGVKNEGFDVGNVMKADAERFIVKLVNTREANEFFRDVFATDDEKIDGFDYEQEWKNDLSPYITEFSGEKSLRNPSVKYIKSTETVYNHDAMRTAIASQLSGANEETLEKIYKLLGNE